MPDTSLTAVDDKDIIKMEREGFLTVPSERLRQRKPYIVGNDATKIFDPPKVGDYVIVLEHFVSPRHLLLNNRFVMESEYEKKYIVYKVLSPEIIHDDAFSPRNRAVLEYRMGKIKRIRYIEYMNFYCGMNCCLPVTESVKRHMNECRGLVDETFEIRRFCKLKGVSYEDVF